MTELECPGLYEDGELCGDCRYCTAVAIADLVLHGSPSDLFTP